MESAEELLTHVVETFGGSRRDGQVQMAVAVESAIASQRHLVVQAGTGTGKSMAYMVPSAAHALSKGRRVVVSTATLALQNQLMTADMPRLVAGLGDKLGRKPRAVVVKGRGNYVCLHKTGGGRLPGQDSLLDEVTLPGRNVDTGTTSLGAQVLRAREFADSSTTGDRDDMAKGVSQQAWRQVSVSGRECLGAADCPVADACFVEKARAQAADADIVITNHAMLALDAFEGYQILPEHDVLIVDEAHELGERVTSAASGEVSEESLKALLNAVRAAGGATGELVGDIGAVTDQLVNLPLGRVRGQLPDQLTAALGSLSAACRSLSTELPETSGDEAGLRNVARRALGGTSQLVDRIISNNEHDVLWGHRDFQAPVTNPVTLKIAPLWVNGLLREHLFTDRTVVLTSATLMVGGSFDATARMWGLPNHDDVAPQGLAWDALEVASPFDYAKQGILYVARDLPAPNKAPDREPFHRRLHELVQAANGATLGLFSSRAGAEQAAAHVREDTELTVLCQGDAPTPELVSRFAEDREVCLFGTLSLWQGVDVPGEACSLVVIDRLPFPRPDDPLPAARSEHIGRSGGNGFMSVSASHAALLLAQGVGRLVRSTDDRGVVAVLDSRLANARYSEFILASLPPLWRTANTEHVLASLRRLSGTHDKQPPA